MTEFLNMSEDVDPPLATYLEHPEDLLGRWLAWRAQGGVALVVVTRTIGGGVRAPGALMVVCERGRKAGYISGGCIDADVALHAREALRSGKAETLIYGAGSPFIDLPLPCGGMIEVTVVPDADATVIQACYQRLAGRRSVTLGLTPSGAVVLDTAHLISGQLFRYMPKLRLRIAGRGADGLAVARLAVASGIETKLQMRDGQDVEEARHFGFSNVTTLTTPDSLPRLDDDPWTAFLLAFHDTDWEAALLTQTLSGPAFFVGAVGSSKTHARRSEQLRAKDVSEDQIVRIRGPVGLVASMRDASMLAVSALAEIVQAFHQMTRQRFSSTALILLAAGQSTRFLQGDKLLAPLGNRPLIEHSAGVLRGEDVAARIAVVAPDQEERAVALRKAGWTVVINVKASTGLASSLAMGIRHAGSTPATKSAMVLLADMPDLTDEHLLNLHEALTPDRSAVMSRLGQTLLPPAIFDRSIFDRLTALTGDAGARQVFDSLDNTATVELPKDSGGDVDTHEDLLGVAALRLSRATHDAIATDVSP